MSKPKIPKVPKGLEGLTPSRHGAGVKMPIEDWRLALEVDGYVKIPVYHSTASRPEEYKSQKVRNALIEAWGKFWYHHATDADGFRYLVIATNKKVFDGAGWPCKRAEKGSE